MTDDMARKRFLTVLEIVFKNDAGKMAQELGIDRSTMTRYKNGANSPSQKILVGLSHARRIRLSWLMGNVGGNEIEYESASAYSLPRLQAPIAGNALIASFGSRDTVPYFCRPKCYYLDVRRMWKDQGILARDQCLIQQITPKPASACERGMMRVLLRNGVLEFDAVNTQDIKKGNLVHGILLRVEREIE